MLGLTLRLILNDSIVSTSGDILKAERRLVYFDVLHLNLLTCGCVEVGIASDRLIDRNVNVSTISTAEVVIRLCWGWSLGHARDNNRTIYLNATALICSIFGESISFESYSVVGGVIFIDVIKVTTIASLSGAVNLLSSSSRLTLDIYIVHIVGACETFNRERIVATIILLDKSHIGSLAIRNNEFALHRLATDVGRDGVGAFS